MSINFGRKMCLLICREKYIYKFGEKNVLIDLGRKICLNFGRKICVDRFGEKNMC